MKFRLKAFGLHVSASAAALGLTLGCLYLGWYHWPGWYLANAPMVIGIMIGVDVVLGPLLTLLIANPLKPRGVLARDISVIAAVQLIALLYGATQLWNGRPLYYAFSDNCLSLVQAYDIDRDALTAARKENAAFLPHWYSLPRWIWAPFPPSAPQGGFDVTARPQYFKPWEQGLPALRTQLITVDANRFFLPKERKLIKQRMLAAGLAVDQPNTIAFTGRARPLLAVIDPVTLKITALIKPS